MKNTIIVIIAIIFVIQSCDTEEKKKSNAIDYQKYKTELENIFILDQKYRLLTDSLEMIYDWDSDTIQNTYQLEHIQDSLNLFRIERIISEIGWPKRTVLGDTATDAAFLVLQHCGNAFVMEKYVPIMQQAADSNELSKSSLALYIDRIKMFKGQKQIYGSQMVYNDSLKKLELYPVENLEVIDSLRKSAGLKPLGEYLKSFGIEKPN
jgi:hypothetical protein